MKKFLSITLGLLLIFLIVYGSYLLLSRVIGSVGQLNPNVLAAIIAAAAATFGFIYNQRQSKKREIKEAHRFKKAEIYNHYLEIMFKFIYAAREGKTLVQKDGSMPNDIEKMFIEFFREIVIWGSSEVIRKFNNFKSYAMSDPNDTHILRLVNELLLAIRKDLGNSNFKLKKGELLKVIINEPEKLDEIFKY